MTLNKFYVIVAIFVIKILSFVNKANANERATGLEHNRLKSLKTDKTDARTHTCTQSLHNAVWKITHTYIWLCFFWVLVKISKLNPDT